MFDFGFSEIVLTSAIALVVLGPERLPKVARQVGNWMGRARSMARQLSEQLEREVSADELLREQTKPKPPLMTRIEQPYASAPAPSSLQSTLPDLHAVSPDKPHEPLHGHVGVAVGVPNVVPAGVPVGVPVGVPDLHAVAPVDVAVPHTSATEPRADDHNPPNE